MLDVLNLEAVREAAKRIAPYVVRTPLLAHGELLLKPESLQPIGAFKLRGAFNKMLSLPKDCPGVVAHSSGNHAQAVARAARVLGFKAVVVMPSDAPKLKRDRTRADGAEIIDVGADSDERLRAAEVVVKERGFVLVPPYDDAQVAAGQGTAALEIIDDAAARGIAIDRFYCPVSGGGLMAGCATVFAALSPGTEIVGVEPADGDDTKRSLAANARVKVDPPRTIADGLRVRTPGELTFPVLQRYVARIETVSDDEMMGAIRFAAEQLRLVLEPSGAASLALARREGRGRSAVLLSGGNVDPDLFRRALGE